MTAIVWASWADFVAMGGYGGYVWGAFGATVVAIAVETVGIVLRRRALRSAAPGDLGATPEWRA